MQKLIILAVLLISSTASAATVSCVTVKSTGSIYTPDGVNYACGNAASAILARIGATDYELRNYTEFANINGWDTATVGAVKTKACKKLTAEEKSALGCP